MTRTATLKLTRRGNVMINHAYIDYEADNIAIIRVCTDNGSLLAHMYGEGIDLPGVGVSKINPNGTVDKDRTTIIAFPQFPGWEVYFATTVGCNIHVCLVRPNSIVPA